MTTDKQTKPGLAAASIVRCAMFFGLIAALAFILWFLLAEALRGACGDTW